jgi:hypothetical protein
MNIDKYLSIIFKSISLIICIWTLYFAYVLYDKAPNFQNILTIILFCVTLFTLSYIFIILSREMEKYNLNPKEYLAQRIKINTIHFRWNICRHLSLVLFASILFIDALLSSYSYIQSFIYMNIEDLDLYLKHLAFDLLDITIYFITSLSVIRATRIINPKNKE